ncbi:MAG: hypothetical protein AAFY56_12505 [Pseudomonadota bacterium]
MRHYLGFALTLLIAACATERPPPPPDRVQTSLPVAQARERVAALLEQQGWTVAPDSGQALRGRTNNTGLAACRDIQVRDNEGSTGRRRFAEAQSVAGEVSVQFTPEANGAVVQWQTSFEGTYRNTFKNLTFQAGCASSGETERMLDRDLRASSS